MRDRGGPDKDAKARLGSTVRSRVLTFVTTVFFVSIALFAYEWWASEERVIKRRLNALAATLSSHAGGELAMVERIAQLRTHVAPNVHLRFGGEEVVSRDAVLALLGRWKPPEDFSVEFVDVTVTLGDDSNARIGLTAKISNRDARTGEPSLDFHEANVAMAKLDGDWVIAGVESAETLQRP